MPSLHSGHIRKNLQYWIRPRNWINWHPVACFSFKHFARMQWLDQARPHRLPENIATQMDFLPKGDKFNGAQNTLPNLLKAQGYSTAVFGKWDLGTEPEGFDYWEILADENEFYNPLFWSPTGNAHFEGHTTDVITDLSLQWIEKMQSEKKPFFAMIPV